MLRTTASLGKRGTVNGAGRGKLIFRFYVKVAIKTVLAPHCGVQDAERSEVLSFAAPGLDGAISNSKDANCEVSSRTSHRERPGIMKKKSTRITLQ